MVRDWVDVDGHLPTLVGSTLYRVVAEGLTNAGRHGTGPVTLEISTAADRSRS